MKRAIRGYTLIELMLTAGAIGVLSGVAVPKVAQTFTHAKEAMAKGNLATLRSALSIYYTENNLYPRGTEGGIRAGSNGYLVLARGSKYLAQIPPGYYPSHPDYPLDTYLYWDNNTPAAPITGAPECRGREGQITLSCQWIDSRGVPMCKY